MGKAVWTMKTRLSAKGQAVLPGPIGKSLAFHRATNSTDFWRAPRSSPRNNLPLLVPGQGTSNSRFAISTRYR